MELSDKQIHILTVAEKLFAEVGYDGTSVRTIAQEANVNIAMINYYFGSKEKLLDTLLSYRIFDFGIYVENLLSEEMDYLDKIDVLVSFAIKRIHRNRRMYKIVLNESSNAQRNIKFDDYLKQKKENHKFVYEFVRQGQKAGAFSKDVNIALIVPTIFGTYFHFMYNQEFFRTIHNIPSEISVEDYINQSLIPHVQKTIKALLTYEN